MRFSCLFYGRSMCAAVTMVAAQWLELASYDMKFILCSARWSQKRSIQSKPPAVSSGAFSTMMRAAAASLWSHGATLGCNDWLAAPFSAAELAAKVKALLESKRLHEVEAEHAKYRQLLRKLSVRPFEMLSFKIGLS